MEVENTPAKQVEVEMKHLRASKKMLKRAESIDQGENPVSHAVDEIEEVVVAKTRKCRTLLLPRMMRVQFTCQCLEQ